MLFHKHVDYVVECVCAYVFLFSEMLKFRPLRTKTIFTGLCLDFRWVKSWLKFSKG